MRTVVVALMCLLALGVVAPGNAGEPKKDAEVAAELKSLQGKWKVVRRAEGGEEQSAEQVAKADMELTVKDNIGILRFGKKEPLRLLITIQAKADPKQLDLLRVDDKGKPAMVPVYRRKGNVGVEYLGEKEATPAKAIYAVKGDEFWLCVPNAEDGTRPESFDDWKKRRRSELMVLARVKD